MIAKSRKGRKGNSKENAVFYFLFLVVIGFLLSSLVVANIKMYQKKKDLTERLGSLKNKVEKLEKEKRELQEGLSRAQKESYWEGKAREQGYIKEGEEMVVVVPPHQEAEERKAGETNFPQDVLIRVQTWLANLFKGEEQ